MVNNLFLFPAEVAASHPVRRLEADQNSNWTHPEEMTTKILTWLLNIFREMLPLPFLHSTLSMIEFGPLYNKTRS